jgi:hypothetical protein
VIGEDFGRGLPAEGLAGAAVEGSGDGVEVVAGVLAEVGAFREVLAQPVGVLVAATLQGLCGSQKNEIETD